MSSDPFNLERFILAQEPVYAQALREILDGRKQSHWMWFIFPQLRGLGHSEAAMYYGISGAAEATAYLNHAVLGPRLRACAEAALKTSGRSAEQIFGHPDDLKLRSSATLFAIVAEEGSIFQRVLDEFFAGEPDPQTVDFLANIADRDGAVPTIADSEQ